MVYFDHDDIVGELVWDDFVANPVAQLPRVLRLEKVDSLPKTNSTRLLDSYRNLPSSITKIRHIKRQRVQLAVDVEESCATVSDDSHEDFVFVDNDNGMGDLYDDLFAKNVDELVSEVQSKGKNALGDDEDLCVADLGEERAMLIFRTFRPLDLNNHVFKVRMVLATVELLRREITEYGVKNRVELK